MITLIRGIISKFTATVGKPLRFSATGRSGESFDDRTAHQQFGFASGLPVGSEAILLKAGQNVYLIASDNSQYRIAIEDGETAIYNKNGDHVILKSNQIEVNAPSALSRVIVNAASVELGGETMDPTDGCVTGKCACAAYGVPHPVVSPKVKAKMV